jgi:hypothetical protein
MIGKENAGKENEIRSEPKLDIEVGQYSDLAADISFRGARRSSE